MEIYLDLVMGLNFLVDLLLLLGTNRLSGFPAQWGRLLTAALLGAVYSGACLLRSFRFLGALSWRTVFLCLMAVTAFGWNRSAVKRGSIFLLLSMALGGIAVSMDKRGFPALLLAAAGIFLICAMGFGDGIGNREYENMELIYGDRKLSVLALRDTGNGLRDPVTGEGVAVISGAVAQKLTGLTLSQLADPIGTMAQRPIPGLRLVPYRCVGNGGGLLLALRFENCMVGGRRKPTLVAFAPDGLGRGEAFQALTGGI